jgi:hypothetical protein
MTRKALARRIAEVLFNEPATRRGAGAAPTREGLRGFGRMLCCSSVKDQCGYSPSPRRAPSQNSQQRCHTSLRLGALVSAPSRISAGSCWRSARLATCSSSRSSRSRRSFQNSSKFAGNATGNSWLDVVAGYKREWRKPARTPPICITRFGIPCTTLDPP